MRKLKVVTVYWRDHTSDVQWRDEKELRKWAKEEFQKPCSSSGFIVFRTSKYLVIAGEKNSLGQYGNYTMVMNGAITRKKVDS